MFTAAIWQCPLTKRDLDWADAAVVADVNARVEAGDARLRDGTVLDRPVDAVLTTDDGTISYPVVGGVILLLASSAIETGGDLDPLSDSAESKRSVRAFYDDVGWTKTDDGVFADTDLFEDLRPVSAEYNRRTRLRVRDHLVPEGRYLLDIASGAVPFDEYEAYSSGYERRICADFSIRALLEARERLGERGVYVQCDITRIPLRDGSVDGFVSLHTIYHVQAEEQRDAYAELVRVLGEGRRGVVVYTWAFPSALMAPFHPVALVKRSVKWLIPERLERAIRVRLHGPGAAEPRGLYFSPHGLRWFRRHLAEPYGAELACWRSVGLAFQLRYAHERFGGRRLLALLLRLEERWPARMGRIGQYPMFLFEKRPT